MGADIADVSQSQLLLFSLAYILTDRFDDVHKPNLEFMMALVYGVRAKKSALDEKMTTYLAKIGRLNVCTD